jgi:membrane fusion protein (multidrug efflux system)
MDAPSFRPSPALLAAALFAGGFPACKKSDPAAAAPPPPAVLVAPAGQRKVDIVRSWTGTLDGSANVDVRTRVSGYLTKVHYADGQSVKKGDRLFSIDPRPFEAALREAEAAHLEAVARRTKAAQDVERYRPLAASKAISREELDHAIQALEAAEAGIEAALAGIEQAKLSLAFTEVASEVDGIAGFANPGVGDLVGPSDPKPLTTISTVDPIKVKFQVSEQEYLEAKRRHEQSGKAPTDVPDVRVGLILADRSRHPHEGKMVGISREVNTQTGTFEVTAHFPNPNNKLRPGQFARVDAVIATLDAVVVPQRAVSEVQGSYQIAVVSDGKAEIRPVKVGPRDGSDWVIESGLKAGETVIVEGIQKVRGGTPVNASPWTPPAAAQASQPEAK